MIDVPQRLFLALQEVAARLFDSRKANTDLERFARELLAATYDMLAYAGQDSALAQLGEDLTDRGALADHPTWLPALTAQLGTIDLDGGTPRNAKARQLAESIVAALGLAMVDDGATVSLGDDVRSKAAAALAEVINVELVAATMREAIIADARTRCDANFHSAFTKVVAQLDDRGLQLVKQPKVPIDAMRAIQRALFEARNALVDRIGRAAIDRAQRAIAAADPAIAARIDQPITLRSTPREVAILRACDPRVGKTPPVIAHSLLESLTELLRIVWRAPEQPVQTYGASKTFAVGDLLEHPKFGRGAVVASLAQHIDVEFSDGKHRLAHVPPRR